MIHVDHHADTIPLRFLPETLSDERKGFDLVVRFKSRGRREIIDLVTVKELLGHADIKLTMRYAHPNVF